MKPTCHHFGAGAYFDPRRSLLAKPLKGIRRASCPVGPQPLARDGHPFSLCVCKDKPPNCVNTVVPLFCVCRCIGMHWRAFRSSLPNKLHDPRMWLVARRISRPDTLERGSVKGRPCSQQHHILAFQSYAPFHVPIILFSD